MTPGKIVGLVGGVLIMIAVFVMGGSLVENLDASEQMVVQYLNGTLEVYATPGWKSQWLGRVTKYHKRTNFSFLAPQRGGKGADNSIEVRFNDAGHANISGTIAYELPTDKAKFLRLHSLYGSQDAVEKALVEPAVVKSIYMTGPLMSSKESYAERRNELPAMIDDQIRNGIYKTHSFQRKEKDAISGEEKTVTVVEVVMQNGLPAREDVSPLREFDIRTFNLAINGVLYSPEVEAQIKEQQQMTMAVQTSKMEALRAEQQRITTEQSGMASAAKEKWEQEAMKAREVTIAEKNLAVARLDVQTAEAEKRANILRGEGEAEAKRLVMNADGALEKKLAAIVEINSAYATAIQNYAGNWQPAVVMAGQGGGSAASMVPGGGALPLIELLTAKTARDLSLDLSLTGAAKTRKGE